VSLGLCRDVLVGDLYISSESRKEGTTYQVHTVSGTRDQTGVRHGKHRVEFVKGNRSMEVVDRRVVHCSESSVDFAD
jgi:predicted RecB family endonuclease